MPLNPFRSEAEAYRFVWLTIGYFGLIVAGALINRWLGLAVFIVLSAIVLYSYFRRGDRATRHVTARSRSARGSACAPTSLAPSTAWSAPRALTASRCSS